MKHHSKSSLTQKVLRSLKPQDIRQGSDEGAYKTRVLLSLMELENIIAETERQIELLPTLNDYYDAVATVKSYFISWCTLSDMLAALVNVVFNLGIAKRDVTLRLVLGNEHVKKTRIPDIFKQHKQKIKTSYIRGTRNEIVHRGILNDADLESIRARLDRLVLLAVFGEEQEDETRQVELDLQDYLLSKQDEFTRHLSDTLEMIKEVEEYLSNVFDRTVDS